jgi:hypothetical protein
MATTFPWIMPKVEAGQTMLFTLSYTAGSTVSSFTTELVISTNDPNTPNLSIPISLTSGSDGEDPGISPVITALDNNFPNPFNPETTIRYSLKEAGQVKINIFNMKGQMIRSLLNENKSAGNHRVIWNGKDDRGSKYQRNIFLRMEPPILSNKKMIADEINNSGQYILAGTCPSLYYEFCIYEPKQIRKEIKHGTRAEPMRRLLITAILLLAILCLAANRLWLPLSE